MADLLALEDLPPGFTYPPSFIRTVELDLTNLEPWWILQGERLRSRADGLRKRFRKRTLVPFAERQDNDDVACFDVDLGEVCVVHDFADSGWERREVFTSFDAWFRQAVDDYLEWGADE